MDVEALKGQAWELDYNVARNVRYYRWLYFMFACLERSVRIIVGVLAVLGLISAVTEASQISVWLAVASVFVAILLNILPFHNYELRFGVLLEGYATLHGRIRQFESREFGFLFANGEEFIRHRYESKGTPVSKRAQEQFADLLAEHAELEATEAFDWGRLNRYCQQVERQSRWGKAIVTAEAESQKIDELKAKHHPDHQGSPAAA